MEASYVLYIFEVFNEMSTWTMLDALRLQLKLANQRQYRRNSEAIMLTPRIIL